MSDKIVSVKGLKKYFPIYHGIIPKVTAEVRAVDEVSFDIEREVITGLVGESGCGKSTLGRTILRLIEPTSGEVYFNGTDIFKLRKAEMRRLRPRMQMIFQDPGSSLDPRMTVLKTVKEAYNTTKRMQVSNNERNGKCSKEIQDLIESVGLNSDHLNKYPHELSGGETQRVAIARALATCPQFIVGDECASSLDLSIQSQILNLMIRLVKELNLSILYISHDLSVVRQICTNVAIMYLGKIVEMGSCEDVMGRSMHPYTGILLSAVPIPDVKACATQRVRMLAKGEPPSPINPPVGCRFHTRCPCAEQTCAEKEPELVHVQKGHFVACHKAN